MKKTKTKKRKLKLKSIAEEKKACRAAFKKYPDAERVWCCHHEKHCEFLGYYTPSERIKYISANKPKDEHAIRFRNFRPVKRLSNFPQTKIGRRRLHNSEWPTNTWNGETIFSRNVE